MPKAYLTPEYVQFFAELRENNNAAWFQANRSRYEQHVKKPFEQLVLAAQAEIRALDPSIPEVKPSQLIFRINRDIRFAKDKSPYKAHMSAFFSGRGRKANYPGFYFELSAERLWVGGGLYELTTEELRNVRQEIRYNMEMFNGLVTDPAFVAHYEKILGERNKTLPADLREDAAAQPLLFNKQFYFAHTYPVSLITSADLLPALVESYRIAMPLNAFLAQAFVVAE